jgi:hypothetical protein
MGANGSRKCSFLKKGTKNLCPFAAAQAGRSLCLVATAQEKKFFGSFFQKRTLLLPGHGSTRLERLAWARHPLLQQS